MTKKLRILITTPPWQNHYWMFVPLGWALRAAGHDVRVACLAGFAPCAAASGLPVIAAGDPGDAAGPLARLGGPPGDDTGRGANLRNIVRFNAQTSARLLDGLLPVVRTWQPDVIVHDPVEMAGPLLGGLLDVPTVLHPFGLPLRDRVAVSMRRGAAALQVRYGIPDRLGEPDLVLDTCPPGFAAAVEPPVSGRQPMRHVPYGGSGHVAGWLREPVVGARVCVTTTIEPPEAEYVPRLLELAAAIASDEIEAVVPLTAEFAAGAAAPPGVRVVEHLPLDLLAPTCSAVVHRGEASCALTFMANGVSQIVLPLSGEEPRVGDALVATGCGRSVAATRPADEVAAAVRTVLGDDGYRKAAAVLAEECQAMPSPAAVVAEIEALVANRPDRPAYRP